MKFVVLLALVGLASCRTALIGGDRARDVTIEYSYLDDQGKEVQVEVKADNLDLDLSRDEADLSIRGPESTPVRPVHVPELETTSTFVQQEREYEPVQARFIEVEPQPIRRPEVDTHFIHVEPQPIRRPEVDTHFIRVEPQPAPRPRTETRFVQVAAEPQPAPVPQFVQVQPVARESEVRTVQFIDTDDFRAPASRPEVRFVPAAAAIPETRRPEFETRFVTVEAPRRQVVTQFVQQAEPVHRQLESRPRFVQVEQRPFTFQAAVPRPVAAVPSTSHFRVAQPISSVRSVSSGFERHARRSHSFSEDNSAEK